MAGGKWRRIFWGVVLALLVLVFVILTPWLPTSHRKGIGAGLGPVSVGAPATVATVSRGLASGLLTVKVAPELGRQCLVGALRFNFDSHAVFFNVYLDPVKFDRANYDLHPWHYSVFGADGLKLRTKAIEMVPSSLGPGQTVQASVLMGPDYENLIVIEP